MPLAEPPVNIKFVDERTGQIAAPWSDWCVAVYNIVKAIPGQTEIVDASTAHVISGAFDNAEVAAALDALGSKINEILSLLATADIMD